jgi:CMP-N,N'-diacetyllegionaminic acid synthase
VTTAAIIPARGGSKRIPLKQLAKVGDKSLTVRAIESAIPHCDRVYVSTDHDKIARVAEDAGAIVVWRPKEISGDTATTESVMEHWWASMPVPERPDVIALLQPTSPLRTERHVGEALALLRSAKADSVVSVVSNPLMRFEVAPLPNAGWLQVRRDWSYRPRTQEISAYHENGAIFLTTKEAWLMSRCRVSGVCAGYVMDKIASIDVDDSTDLAIANALIEMQEDA